MVKCISCGKVSDGSYCPECGQKMHFARMTVKTIFYEKIHDITHWENTVLYTVRHLILDPGITVRSYISGIRKNIVKPFRYFLSVSAFHILIYHWLGNRYFEYYLSSFGSSESEQIAKERQLQNILFKYLNYFETLLPLFFSFFFFLLYRKKFNVSYAESIAISFYWVGTALALSVVSMLLSLVDIKFWYTGIIIICIYLLFASLQFSSSRKTSDIIRSVLFIALSYASFLLLIGSAISFYIEHFYK